jgi:hypothetical protein
VCGQTSISAFFVRRHCVTEADELCPFLPSTLFGACFGVWTEQLGGKICLTGHSLAMVTGVTPGSHYAHRERRAEVWLIRVRGVIEIFCVCRARACMCS